MFIKSSLRGQKVHKSMKLVHDLATLLFSAIPCALRHFPRVNERVIDARRSRRRLDIPDTFQL